MDTHTPRAPKDLLIYNKFRQNEDRLIQYIINNVDETIHSKIIFMGGKRLMEKFDIYKTSDLLVRFGSGSYHKVWNLFHPKHPSNHILVNDRSKDLSYETSSSDYILRRSSTRKNVVSLNIAIPFQHQMR